MRGEQPLVDSPGGKRAENIMGVVDPFGGEVHTAFTKKHTAASVRRFIVDLFRIYRHKKKIILVLDNAPIHHATALKKFLERVKYKLEVIFLPPYSPELNPIERFWRFLRKKVTHNTFYETFEKFSATVRAFLEKYKTGSEEILSLCKVS